MKRTVVRLCVLTSLVMLGMCRSAFTGQAGVGLGPEPPARHFVVAAGWDDPDPLTGVKEPTAWLEYPPGRYMIELEKEGIISVRLLKLTRAREFKSVRHRLEDIRERLEYAIDRLFREQGAHLAIGEAQDGGVGIFLQCDPVDLSQQGQSPRYPLYPIRILTVDAEDADGPASFAFHDPAGRKAERTPQALAAFLAAQIEAHFLLFIRLEPSYDPYEHITIDQTIRGKIYREIYLRARDVMQASGKPFSAELVRDALGRVSPQQRSRLHALGQMVPPDWRRDMRGRWIFQK